MYKLNNYKPLPTRTSASLDGEQIESVDVPAADRAAAILRDQIIEGHIGPGARLTESSLTKAVGVSRNTVREALRQLRVDGLVEHSRNRGVFVRYFAPREVIDIYKMRRTLEIQALQQFVAVSQGELDSLLNAIQDAEAAIIVDNWRRVGSSSLRFHQAIVALLDCHSLSEVFRSGMAQMRLLFSLMNDEKTFQKPWIARDRAIYEALAAGQRETAINALTVYLADSERAVIDAVRASNPTS